MTPRWRVSCRFCMWRHDGDDPLSLADLYAVHEPQCPHTNGEAA